MEVEIICVGDHTDHGGVVLDGIPGTDLYGRPMAGIGNMVMCPKCRGPFPIIEGAAHYEINGVQVALRGMKTACGAVLIAGNPRAQGLTHDCNTRTHALVSAGRHPHSGWLAHERH